MSIESTYLSASSGKCFAITASIAKWKRFEHVRWRYIGLYLRASAAQVVEAYQMQKCADVSEIDKRRTHVDDENMEKLGIEPRTFSTQQVQ